MLFFMHAHENLGKLGFHLAQASRATDRATLVRKFFGSHLIQLFFFSRFNSIIVI
jgi:hypothetical protein